MHTLIAFGRFWYDFIVGDSIVLAVGGALALLATFLLVQAGAEVAAEALLPLLVVLTLTASLRTHPD
ncbi:MAG: hypothetical protein AB7R89_31855 [Dehalococcoidia bacterium]